MEIRGGSDVGGEEGRAARDFCSGYEPDKYLTRLSPPASECAGESEFQMARDNQPAAKFRLGYVTADLLPNLPSFIRRVCSSFAPAWGVLRTQLV
jgi:hypothetical protein